VKEKQQKPPVNKTRLVTGLKRLRQERKERKRVRTGLEVEYLPPDNGCKNIPTNKTRKKQGGGGGIAIYPSSL